MRKSRQARHLAKHARNIKRGRKDTYNYMLTLYTREELAYYGYVIDKSGDLVKRT